MRHIFEYMEKDDFVFDEVGTKFQGGTLVVYYRGHSISIETFFKIVNKNQKVSLTNFKKDE